MKCNLQQFTNFQVPNYTAWLTEEKRMKESVALSLSAHPRSNKGDWIVFVRQMCYHYIKSFPLLPHFKYCKLTTRTQMLHNTPLFCYEVTKYMINVMKDVLFIYIFVVYLIKIKLDNQKSNDNQRNGKGTGPLLCRIGRVWKRCLFRGETSNRNTSNPIQVIFIMNDV